VDGSTHPVSSAVLDGIAEIVGEKGLIRDPADIEPYVIDQRKAYIGATPMVIRQDCRSIYAWWRSSPLGSCGWAFDACDSHVAGLSELKLGRFLF